MVQSMETSNGKKWYLRRVIRKMLVVGIWGLFICHIIRNTSGGEKMTDIPLPLFIAASFFSALCAVALLVLFPIQYFYFDRKERKNKPSEPMALDDVAGLHSGEFDPHAQLPKWISIPAKILLWAVVIFFILFVGLVLIGLGVSHFLGPEG